MNKNSFQLKYQVTEISRLKSQQLSNLIFSHLKTEGYKIVERTDTSIAFNDFDGPFFRMRGIDAKLDEGIFEFNENDGVTTLNLTYIVPYGDLLFGVFAILIYSYFTGFINLYGEIIVVILFLVRISKPKNISRGLMAEIVSLVDPMPTNTPH